MVSVNCTCERVIQQKTVFWSGFIEWWWHKSQGHPVNDVWVIQADCCFCSEFSFSDLTNCDYLFSNSNLAISRSGTTATYHICVTAISRDHAAAFSGARTATSTTPCAAAVPITRAAPETCSSAVAVFNQRTAAAHCSCTAAVLDLKSQVSLFLVLQQFRTATIGQPSPVSEPQLHPVLQLPVLPVSSLIFLLSNRKDPFS